MATKINRKAEYDAGYDFAREYEHRLAHEYEMCRGMAAVSTRELCDIRDRMISYRDFPRGSSPDFDRGLCDHLNMLVGDIIKVINKRQSA